MIFCSWSLAEIIKFFVNFFIRKKSDFRIFLAYGGFPSAHSALVSSLVFSIFLVDGLNISFVIALVLAAIVIRDTITIRKYIDKNSRHIFYLSNNKIKTNFISHSILEIVAGLILGILVPLIIYLLI
jgi:acid phosphatase family membrane protein YuiD